MLVPADVLQSSCAAVSQLAQAKGIKSLLLLLLFPCPVLGPPPCRLVKRAMHGTRMMGWQEIRQFYGREVVNLRNEGRWVFLNTLFSVSEAVMYMQVRACVVSFEGGGCAYSR
jgi:hypothetical protein